MQPILATMACAALTACVAAGPVPTAEPGAAFSDLPVSVGGRAFVATFVPGTMGTVLTAGGAVQVAGTSVRIMAADLGRDEGIIAKEAALAACSEAGGAFQPQAIGRYPAAGSWVFDGACA